MIDTIGHYKVLERLGTNRLGVVYKARDTKHGRTVAVTLVADEIDGDRHRRAQLLEDARAAEACSHPALAALFEIGEADGRPFLVFEFASGDSLDTLVAGRPLNPRRAVDIAAQIADGLADAHAAGLVHGALRPAVVIVTARGNAKIYDVGLTAWTGEGPPAYRAPELVRGEPAEAASDIYSIGVVLHEMLTGRPPPSAVAVASLAPAELAPIVAKALSPVRTDRYESAATMAAELRVVAAALDARSESSPPVRSRRRRSGARRAIGWTLGVLLLGAIAALLWLVAR